MICLYNAAMVALAIIWMKIGKFLDFSPLNSACLKTKKIMRVEESLKQPKPLHWELAWLSISLDHLTSLIEENIVLNQHATYNIIAW